VSVDFCAGLWVRTNDTCLKTKTCKSQNHRIVGVGRDLCGSSSPNPLLKQGHLHIPWLQGFVHMSPRKLKLPVF